MRELLSQLWFSVDNSFSRLFSALFVDHIDSYLVLADASGGPRVGPPHEPHVHCARANNLQPPLEVGCDDVMFLDI